MRNTKYLISILFLFAFFYASSQNSQVGKPPWIKGNLPKNISGNLILKETFDSSLDNALKKAKENLIASVLESKGVKISSTEILNSNSNYKINNGISQSSASSNYVSTIKIEGGAVIQFTKIDHYYEYKNGIYHLWVLYLAAEDGKSLGRVPFLAYKIEKGAWRSFFIPGWSQLYQGRTGKGLFFIAGEAALIGTGVYFNNQYKNNNNHFLEAASAKIKQEYRDRANRKRTYSYIAFGAAGALYIYNIIDALTSKKGKVSYDYKNSRFAFYPTMQYNYATNSANLMATVSIKF